MKRHHAFRCAIALTALAATLQSCLGDSDESLPQQPTALVTVRPSADGTFLLQLDNATALRPTNMTASPFGTKEVRALVSYTEEKGGRQDTPRDVRINWIDSIRTKLPSPDLGNRNDSAYGNDPIEIVKDWVTVAEDGYLTLRIRTLWGAASQPHVVSLLTGASTDDPFQLELRHDARGDTRGKMGDALIAFNLNRLPRNGATSAKLRLSWLSFTGKKTTEFDLQLHPQSSAATRAAFSARVE